MYLEYLKEQKISQTKEINQMVVKDQPNVSKRSWILIDERYHTTIENIRYLEKEWVMMAGII